MTGFPLSDWDEVGDLVEHALELPSPARDGYLRDACGGDAARLARAQRLLAAASSAQSFLDQPAVDLAAGLVSMADPPDAAAPQPLRIGPYRVLRSLGQGGMGDVYLADRDDDQFNRQVAIKVVRAGYGDDLVARFRHERQLLASLDHPHIAQLFDGGVAEDGRPYLVMEFVDGRPIDRYADDKRLTVDERLAIFLQVCDAVDRAHSRLIVHRDLKPGNVLVSERGVVKLLDFGVAKILAQDTTPEAPVTSAGQRVMTPEYASPEQFLGEPTTTAIDVYTLGVLLYELLVGRRPHETEPSSRADLERRVLRGDPPLPSVHCQTSWPGSSAAERAAARRTSVDGLARQLRGDLDNIVLTALQREADRRYGSVAALRADIARHRTGLPVSARPATVRYRAAKFVRRHRVGVAATLVVAAAVVIGTMTTLVQARAAAREGQRAEQIRDFLLGVFEVSDPDRSGGNTVTARELLDRGSQRIDRDLAGNPSLRADMLAVLGTVYRQLGIFDEARRHLEEALTLRRSFPTPPSALVDSLSDLASVRLDLGDADGAETLIREALDLAVAEEGTRGPRVASAMSRLAAVHRSRGQYAEAERLTREALQIRRDLSDPAGLAETLNVLGVLLGEAGRPGDAVEALREALALSREVHGDLHTRVALAECNLAQALHRDGQPAAALETFERCIRDRRRLLGDRHPDVGSALANMGLVHSDRNEYEPAERLMLEALAIQRAAYGEHHRAVAGTLNNLAILAFQQQHYVEAANRFRDLIAIWRTLVGSEHSNTLTTTNNLGMSLRSAGDLAGAESILTEVLHARERALGSSHPAVAESLLNLASVVHRMTRFAQARQLAEQALGILGGAHPDGHPATAIAYMTLGRARLGERAPEAALADFDRALALRTRTFGETHLQTAEARVGRARALTALGRTADARRELDTALAHLRASGHSDSVTAQEAASALAELGG